MVYKTKEDLDLVLELKKPERVVKLFYVSYMQGLAYQKFLDKVKEEYEESYPGDVEYVIYDSYTEKYDDITQNTYLEPNVDNPENKKLKPTFELFLQDKLKSYKDPEITEEVFREFYKPYKRKSLNEQRDKEVANLTVTLTLDGENVKFDADETSQLRITRAIQILENTNDTLEWIDASGVIKTLTKGQIKQGLALAAQKQSEIFMKYAKEKEEL